MPRTCLDTADAIELAQTLQLIIRWLAADPERLAASLLEYIGHPAYGPDALRADLDRFAFLLGGNDGEFLLGEDRPTAAVSKTDPMTPAIVPVTPSHRAFGQVAALFDDYRAHYGQPPSPQLTRDWLHRQLAQHQMTITAAIQAGQACGFITTTVMPASQRLGTAWSIRDLYIAPQHRRHGIARTLLQHVIDGARAAGALRVSLQTEAGNTPALTLYTAVGFQPDNDLALLSLTLPPGNQQDPQNTV